MKNIVIIGNGIGSDILFKYLQSDDRYNVAAFSVDKEYIESTQKFSLPVVPLEDLSSSHPANSTRIILGVGYSGLNKVRTELFKRVKAMGYTVETYIHPTATVFEKESLGEGAIVLANSVVEPFASVGENSFVWCNCTIAHHSKIGNNIWIASGTVVSGEAEIKDRTFVGVGAVISNNVIVAEDNLIGADAFITRSTKENEVWLSRSSEKHRFDAINYSKLIL